MPICHDGKKMKPYRGYRKPVNVYYGDKKVAGWKNSTQTGNNLTFQTTYNDTADVVVKGKTLQKSEWVHKQGLTTQQTWTGKNQNNAVPSSGYYYDSTGLPSGANSLYIKLSPISCNGNLNYTMSCNLIIYTIWCFDNAGVAITKLTVENNDISFTTPSNCTELRVSLRNTSGVADTSAYEWGQLELGSTATSYEPYVGGIPSPNPSYPQPLISNLPAGTYKTKDRKGDWYEFTLTDDLCGIGEVRDAVEWDKYGHKGFERRKNAKVVFDGSADELWGNQSEAYPTPNTMLFYTNGLVGRKGYSSEGWTGVADISSHFVNPKQSLQVTTYDDEAAIGNRDDDYSIYYYVRINKTRLSTQDLSGFRSWLAANPVTVAYQLATPTRTPLTFTLNNASTAPECPMEFLTDTPSLEYPAEVFDASGTVKVRGKNLLPFPLDLETYTVTHHGVPPRTSSTQTDEIVRIQGAEEEIDTAFRLSSPMFSLNSNTTYTISFRAYVDSPTFTLWDMTSLEWSVALVSQSGVRLSQQQYLYTVQKTWTTYKFVATTNSEGLYYLRLGSDFPNLINGFILIDRHSIQIEEGSEATGYEPYRPEVSAPIPPLRSNQDGTVCDEFEVKTGNLTRKIGRIESYNGEDVGDDWISSTGALDTGATVEYVLAEPIEEQYTPVILPTYYPTTVITTTNNTPAELETTTSVKVEDD
jgi:hypothetical protein